MLKDKGRGGAVQVPVQNAPVPDGEHVRAGGAPQQLVRLRARRRARVPAPHDGRGAAGVP